MGPPFQLCYQLQKYNPKGTMLFFYVIYLVSNITPWGVKSDAQDLGGNNFPSRGALKFTLPTQKEHYSRSEQ